jgi:hypothetical protein
MAPSGSADDSHLPQFVHAGLIICSGSGPTAEQQYGAARLF